MAAHRTVEDNPLARQYELRVDGDLAGVAAYRDEDGTRVFTHTRVGDDYEGQGIGSALARGALDDTRARGMRVIARCPFVAEFISRRAEYADLLES